MKLHPPHRSNAPLPITISKLMVLFYQEVREDGCSLGIQTVKLHHIPPSLPPQTALDLPATCALASSLTPPHLSLSQEYNSWCVLSECLTLEPRVTRTLSFSFPTSQTTVGDTLEVRLPGIVSFSSSIPVYLVLSTW